MPILSLASYQPDIFSTLVCLVGIFILSLGVWVLMSGRHDRERRSYFILSTLIGLELQFVALPLAALDRGVADVWDLVGWAVACLLPAAVLDFEAIHLRIPAWRRWTPYLAVAGACMIALMPAGYFVDAKRVVTYPWGTLLQLTWGGYAFVLMFYGAMAVSIRGHWKRMREPGLPDRQRRTYRLTFLAMLFGLMATSDFLGYVGIPWPPFSFLFLAVWMGLYASAILRHKLFRLTTEIAAPAIIESMPSALFVVNMDGEIVIVNPHASKLTRVAATEMQSRRVTEFIPKAAGLLLEASEHPPIGPLRSETEAALKDGSGGERPVVLSAMPIRDERGVPIGVTIIATDVSKLSEQVGIIRTQKEELMKTVDRMGKIQEQLVGRELRMIELKKEIEELKKK